MQGYVSQAFPQANLACQLQHRRAIVQRRHVLEAPSELGQEFAIAGADFQGIGLVAELEVVEQGQQAFAVLRQAGDQILLGAEFFLDPREKILAGSRTLLLDLGHAQLHIDGQLQAVDLFEQCRMQPAADVAGIGQGAAVEDRIAFTPCRHQVSLGQHLQVMAHAGLADGEDLRQFQHAERIVAEYAQHIQPQRVAAGFAQGCQFVAVFRAEGGRTDIHGAQSSERGRCLQ
ncbi:hypothetical protein D9M71_525540 [compost metagenome]